MRIKNTLASAIARVRAQKRRLALGVMVTLLAALASSTLGAGALGRFISGGTIDLLTRRATLHPENRIVLIDITESDFKNLFGRKRPLDPVTILKLIQAALAGGAALVAVDITTEDWPADSDKIQNALNSLGSGTDRPAIVWARNFTLGESHTRDSRDVYVLQPLLGGLPSTSGECYGVPALAEEAGIVRWFKTGLEVNSVYEPSFVEQILYRIKHRSCLQNVNSDELRLISFSAKISSESAGNLWLESQQKDWGVRVRPYAGCLVIIGGSFHEGGDVRVTPVGPLSGLEITGQAIASALNGEARAEVGETTSVVIDGAIGLLIVLLGVVSHRLEIWGTGAAFLVAVVGMWFLWRQYYLFLSFVPIFIGLIAHLLLEKPFRRAGSGSHASGSHSHA